MAQIPDDVIQEILDKADIESVVGKYVTFTKRSGNNLFGLCPFHSEKTPSFSISKSKNIYKCFGCQKAGNSIGFIMEIERLTFPEAVRFLGKEFGVEVPETHGNYDGDRNRKHKDRIYALLTDAARFYYRCFTSPMGKDARDYAKMRNLSPTTLTNFGIGFAPDSWDALYKELSSKGYTDEEMEGSGLFTHTRNTGKLIDLFRYKLMFPIFDAFGKIVAFGGRAMRDEKPKYINSPDSDVYKKQEHLYALNFAKKDRTEQLIVVEGYMDAIAIHQAGIKNAVASLGTAFTDSQLKLVSRYAKEVVFFFDVDNAGKNAAVRAIRMMMDYLRKYSGISVRIKIAQVPEESGCKDPDEFIKKFGPEAFRGIVLEAKDVEDYLMTRAYEDSFVNNRLDLGKYQDFVLEYGSWIPDEIKRYRMASQANIYLKATPEILADRMVRHLEDKRNKYAADREQARATEQEIRRRNDVSRAQDASGSNISYPNTEANSQAPGGIPKDYVNELEIETFCYAVQLGGKLLEHVKKELILRPNDFYGENMKTLVTYFLSHFVAGQGVREDLLVMALRDMLFNGKIAELVFIENMEKIPLYSDSVRLAGEYKLRIIKLRRDMLLNKKKYITTLLDKMAGITDPARKEKLYEALRKIDAGLEYLKREEDNL